MKMNKKAIKTAALTAVIVLVVFEALAFLVTLIDPAGELLRINMGNPLLHVVIVIAALGFGVSAYVREQKKGE